MIVCLDGLERIVPPLIVLTLTVTSMVNVWVLVLASVSLGGLVPTVQHNNVLWHASMVAATLRELVHA